jgi:hypothetical protein
MSNIKPKNLEKFELFGTDNGGIAITSESQQRLDDLIDAVNWCLENTTNSTEKLAQAIRRMHRLSGGKIVDKDGKEVLD